MYVPNRLKSKPDLRPLFIVPSKAFAQPHRDSRRVTPPNRAFERALSRAFSVVSQANDSRNCRECSV